MIYSTDFLEVGVKIAELSMYKSTVEVGWSKSKQTAKSEQTGSGVSGAGWKWRQWGRVSLKKREM